MKIELRRILLREVHLVRSPKVMESTMAIDLTDTPKEIPIEEVRIDMPLQKVRDLDSIEILRGRVQEVGGQ